MSTEEAQVIRPSSRSVTKLHVENLFGRYTYEFDASDEPRSRLILIYGENGTGKTAILRLLFGLLAAKPAIIRSTLFTKLRVDFSDRTWVSVTKESPNSGTFFVSLSQPTDEGDLTLFEFEVTKTEAVQQGSDQPALRQYLAALNLVVYYLNDNRTLAVSASEIDEEFALERRSIRNRLDVTLRSPERVSSERLQQMELEFALRRLSSWIRRLYQRASIRGRENVNVIYKNIVDDIMHPHGKAMENVVQETSELIRALQEQALRSEDFAKYGLLNRVDVDSMVEAIKSSDDTKRLELIIDVVRPYVDGVRASLDALSGLQEIIATLVNTLSDYYRRDKAVQFSIPFGLSIVTNAGDQLSPAALSSGEKHLLLLFANAVTSQDKPSIFIIDEPELSLNFSWQRTLVQSLLDLVKGGPTQFIMATHSVEMLSLHMDNVVELA